MADPATIKVVKALMIDIGFRVQRFAYAIAKKKPIQSADDFKGLKYRTVGISIDVFTGMGLAVTGARIAGARIKPAMIKVRKGQASPPHSRACRRAHSLASEAREMRRARSSAAASTRSLMSRMSFDMSLCQSSLTTASGANARSLPGSSPTTLTEVSGATG